MQPRTASDGAAAFQHSWELLFGIKPTINTNSYCRSNGNKKKRNTTSMPGIILLLQARIWFWYRSQAKQIDWLTKSGPMAELHWRWQWSPYRMLAMCYTMNLNRGHTTSVYTKLLATAPIVPQTPPWYRCLEALIKARCQVKAGDRSGTDARLCCPPTVIFLRGKYHATCFLLSGLQHLLTILCHCDPSPLQRIR